MEKTFREYQPEGHLWITLSSGEYYPDVLPHACELYKPVLVMFGQLVREAESSTSLFKSITCQPDTWMRTQLQRVFRKYVSPETPVEMLKRRRDAEQICARFGGGFRSISEVQRRFEGRPIPDEALCAILYEYKDRGKKGYDLTERLFELVKERLSSFSIEGPRRAGRDVLLGEVFYGYPKPKRPVDFILRDSAGDVRVVGLARYDSDRGGAQEDDRTGGYGECAREILSYARAHGIRLKVVFINDGPGLILGSMWSDYATLEEQWPGDVRVMTLRMIPERLTQDWIER